MRHPLTFELYRYWSSLCPEKGYPARRDFNPMKVPDCLPHLFVLQYQDDDVRPRLFGSHLDEVLGKQIERGSMFELFDHEVNRFHSELYRLCFTVPSGAALHAWVETPPGGWKEVDNLFLPFHGKDGIQLIGLAVAKDPARLWETFDWVKENMRIERLAFLHPDRPLGAEDFSAEARAYLEKTDILSEEEMIADGERRRWRVNTG